MNKQITKQEAAGAASLVFGCLYEASHLVELVDLVEESTEDSGYYVEVLRNVVQEKLACAQEAADFVGDYFQQKPAAHTKKKRKSTAIVKAA